MTNASRRTGKCGPTGMWNLCVTVLLCCLLSGCVSHRPSGAHTAQLSGAELYQQLCASCHGTTATGEGPVASLLKVTVPDLTRIAVRDGGEFPREDLVRAIDGRWDSRAHGTREMPVWGVRFYDLSKPDDAAERARVDAMIERLVDYLESIQEGA
jgi:hypothetical protein